MLNINNILKFDFFIIIKSTTFLKKNTFTNKLDIYKIKEYNV